MTTPRHEGVETDHDGLSESSGPRAPACVKPGSAPEPARPSQGLYLERGAAITPRVDVALTTTAYLIVYL